MEIKNYFFVDIDYRVGPPNPISFYLDFRVDIGEHGSEAVSNFGVFVCTPRGLEEVLEKEASLYLFGRDHLIVPRFDMTLILKAMQEHIDEIEQYAFNVT